MSRNEDNLVQFGALISKLNWAGLIENGPEDVRKNWIATEWTRARCAQEQGGRLKGSSRLACLTCFYARFVEVVPVTTGFFILFTVVIIIFFFCYSIPNEDPDGVTHLHLTYIGDLPDPGEAFTCLRCQRSLLEAEGGDPDCFHCRRTRRLVRRVVESAREPSSATSLC